MNFRPKTVRRLLILLGVFLVICGGIGGWVLVRLHVHRLHIAQLKDKAVAAYQAGKYPQAAELFKAYLDRDRDSQDHDPEILYEYGDAREKVPAANGGHIIEAIRIFEQYLQVAPTDQTHDVRHRLLKLYGMAQYNREARTLAGRLLDRDPRDAEALQAEVQAMQNDGNYQEALGACRKLNQLTPLDLKWQWEELSLMDKLDQSADELISHANRLLQDHPGDPRFQALLAVAYAKAKKTDEARKALAAAAALPPADVDSSLRILELLYRNGMYQEYDALLARASASFKDPAFRLQEVLRSFERSQLKAVVDQTAALDPKSDQTDGRLLGFRALALYETGHTDQAEPLVKELEGRSDISSQAWANALRVKYAARPLEPAAVMQKYRESIARDPGNPVFHFLLAEAHAATGETDQAIQEWGQAVQLRPSWPLPLFRISRTCSALGRYAEALRAAERLRAIENSPLGAVAYAVSLYGIIAQSPDAATSKAGGELLDLLSQIRKVWPSEPDTLPLYVSLLARRGQREKASEAVKAALALQPPLSDEVLTRLARACDQEQLGLSQQILQKAEQVHGTNPALAVARARELYASGKKDEALALIRGLRENHPNDATWQLAEARFEDEIGDASAIKLWVQLADAHPNDLTIQSDALASPSRLSDRSFWRRVIDRVKAQTGSDGLLWQLEDARWQLTGQTSGKDLEAVVSSLEKLVQASPGVADAHLLLADALLREGKPEDASKATTELAAAHNLVPDDLQTTARLAQLMASQGMSDRAVALVDAVSRLDPLPRAARLWTAGMYADLGYTDAAIKMLVPSAASQESDPGRDALLGQLYARAGRTADASAAYKRVLDSPSAEPDPLAAAAQFFAVAGQQDLSDQCIAKLQKLPVKPGSIDILRAHLAEMRGSPQQELDILLAASKANPQVEQLWQELAGLYLRFGRLDDADKTTAQGLQSIPNSQTLLAMKEQAARIRSIGPQGLGRLLDVISHDPRNRVADLTLQLLADSKARKDSPDKLVASLRQLADQYNSFLPLQELLVERYLEAGDFRQAAEIASRTSALMPNEVGPLRLLCTSQSLAGNWPAAREAATRWRTAASANPLEADLALAAIDLKQTNPDPAAAVKRLASYVADGAPEQQRDAVLPAYCQALIAAGREDDAAAVLQPRAAQGPKWRLTWLQLAAAPHKDADSASQWVARVAPMIPADAVSEQLALAQAWQQVGTQFDSKPALEKAREALHPLLSRPDAAPGAIAMSALVADSLGDLAESERAWRQFLVARPNDPSAQNNLAYVLVREGGAARLTEAEDLVRRAIATAPNVSTFYDTLARVQIEAGKTAPAVQSFRDALARDPRNVEAMIGLADVLQSNPAARDEARTLLTRVNAALQSSGPPLSAPIRKQLDRVKGALSASL